MQIEVMPSLACSLACAGCDRGDGYGPFSDVSSITSYDIIKEVYDKMIFDAPVKRFVVSGGEPTLFRPLPSLLNFLKVLVNGPVEIKTNGAKLLDLPVSTVLAHHWSITVYKETQEELRMNLGILHRLREMGVVSLHQINCFEDLSNVNTELKRDDFNPLQFCFMPTIIGCIERIFPCCRAYTFERTRSRLNDYSVPISSFSLQTLSTRIIETDLCYGCPRMYDCGIITK